MRPQQYRRVNREEEEDEELRTLGSSTCLLPALLLLLILLSLSLALLFLFHPWSPKTLGTLPPLTSTTTPSTSTTVPPTVRNETEGLPFNSTHPGGSYNETWSADYNGTDHGDDIYFQSESQLKTHLISLIRKSEKFMEKITGMEGELLVPVFMLLCFLSSVSIVSICCCIMTKRREARRRQLFGKIITDLQTGDSKTVLLNQSDLED